MIPIAQKPERRSERVILSLPVTVEAHSGVGKVWRELTNLETVSTIGAGFYLTRPFEIGQLIFLTMPVANDLRRYDFDKEHYRVWGIVRHSYKTLRSNFSVYHTGVAFIGPEAPLSYRDRPLAIYRLGELGESGFWQIGEASQAQQKPRPERYTIPIEVSITVCDAEGAITAHENTVTENVSKNGAAVFSALSLNVGDSVKFTKLDGNFSATAVVRNRRVGEDNLPRLHLEFVNVGFPLEGID